MGGARHPGDTWILGLHPQTASHAASQLAALSVTTVPVALLQWTHFTVGFTLGSPCGQAVALRER